jgi:hypothetical protein
MTDDDVYSDRQYRKDRARILKLKDKWLAPLGLRWWHVEICHSREPLKVAEADAANGWRKNGECVAKWQYLKATVTFNMPAVADMADDDLETLFVHELCHALVNEMRNFGAEDGMDHEERVVTALTSAFIWVRAAGEKSGRAGAGRRKSKGKRG